MRKETAISPELSGGVWLSERKAFSLYGFKGVKMEENGWFCYDACGIILITILRVRSTLIMTL